MPRLTDEDDDNPTWTRGDFARARPTVELLGREVAAALQRKPAGLREAMLSQSPLLVADRLAA